MNGIQEHDPLEYGLWGSLIGGLIGLSVALWFDWWLIFISMATWGGAAFGGTLFPAKNPLANPFRPVDHGLH